MKKITILFFMIFAIAKIHAQNYQIKFAGTGASSTVDSVKIENLTQGTFLNLGGADTLHLVGTQRINSGIDKSGMIIYPNPLNEESRLEIYSIKAGNIKIEIFDLST